MCPNNFFFSLWTKAQRQFVYISRSTVLMQFLFIHLTLILPSLLFCLRISLWKQLCYLKPWFWCLRRKDEKNTVGNWKIKWNLVKRDLALSISLSVMFQEKITFSQKINILVQHRLRIILKTKKSLNVKVSFFFLMFCTSLLTTHDWFYEFNCFYSFWCYDEFSLIWLLSRFSQLSKKCKLSLNFKIKFILV